MPRYALTIEYDGTNFCGWQRQPTLLSIQEAIENAFKPFITLEEDQTLLLVASGRTDAGVHALGQVAHIDLPYPLNPDKIMGALNHHLRPHPIAITHVKEVDEEFHARFSALSRSYRYRILNRRAPLTLERKRAWHVPVALDLAAMQEAATYLLGTYDFSSFRDAQCQAHSPIKTLESIDIHKDGDMIFIDVTARSFLHHMVRNITGTLSQVGRGRFSPDDMVRIRDAKDRTKAGPTAVPYGLYFVKVDY
jgi:tRNA pseudouridine38-40 synthase